MPKKVRFSYDSENKKILMTFKENMIITNDGQSETLGPNLDVLGYDGIVLKAAKECLEEMLVLVNGAIANNN